MFKKRGMQQHSPLLFYFDIYIIGFDFLLYMVAFLIIYRSELYFFRYCN
jgi:hypothetical protein